MVGIYWFCWKLTGRSGLLGMPPPALQCVHTMAAHNPTATSAAPPVAGKATAVTRMQALVDQ